MSIRTLWKRKSHAWHEAVILSAVSILVVCSLFVGGAQDANSHYGQRLLAQAHSYRIECIYGKYSLLFEQQIPLLGNEQFQAIARLTPSEGASLQEALYNTHIVRRFGYRQLDQQEKKSYGFDNPVRVSSPGQNTWTIASGLDDYGYALDEKNNLYQLDRDLAAQLKRKQEALRSSNLGIPENIQHIDFQAEWSLLQAHNLWWLQENDHARPADQNACTDWLHILRESRAVSFTHSREQQSSPFIHIQGSDNYGRRTIGIFDHGYAHGSQTHRIIERREQIGNHTVTESFIMNLNAQHISIPQSALASTQMFPIAFEHADSLRLNTLQLRQKEKMWYVQGEKPTDLHLADQQQVKNFFQQLERIPAGKQFADIIGHLRIDETQIDIRSSPTLTAYTHYQNYMFVDKRLFPFQVNDIHALVIQGREGAPDIFSQADDGSWDVDPETNQATKKFISALNAARVKKWSAAYQSQTAWTSTLTVAIGDKRLILRKNDDGLIGIPERNVQGYLDRDSAADLFGDEGNEGDEENE